MRAMRIITSLGMLIDIVGNPRLIGSARLIRGL
jgi:hypothetical protein